MQLTIQTVFPKAREWTGQYGPSCAVRVLFSDGSEGEYVTKPDKAQEHMDRLSALVGKPNDFEIKATKDWQGTTIHTLSGYPGKPQAQQGGGGGGGRTYTPRYTDTKEGFEAEQTAMNARTALMQAVAFIIPQPMNIVSVQDMAQGFFEWLQARCGLSVEAKAAAPSITPTAPAAPVSDVPARQDGVQQGNPQGRFFATWAELSLPDDNEYSRFVIKKILVQLRNWVPEDPLTTRTQLSPAEWTLAAGGLKSYSTMLVRKGLRPMEEPDFQQGVPA